MKVKDYITIALQLLTVGLLIHDKFKADDIDDIDDRLCDVEDDVQHYIQNYAWRIR